MEIFPRTPSLERYDERLIMTTDRELRLIQDGLEVVAEACRKTERDAYDHEDREGAREQAEQAEAMIIKIKEALAK